MIFRDGKDAGVGAGNERHVGEVPDSLRAVPR